MRIPTLLKIAALILILIFCIVGLMATLGPSPWSCSRPKTGMLVRESRRRAIAPALIIENIRSCAQLTTVVVECGPWEERLRQDTVIRFWPDATETISALVSGRIRYGIDLPEISEEDICISPDGQKITIQLPPAKKLQAHVWLARSRIIDHKKSWYWVRDQSLREAVLQQAELRLESTEMPQAKALAREHAQEIISRLIRQVAGPDVAVEFADPNERK